MKIKTVERLQPQDAFEAEVYKKPTDERLKKFKVGKLVQFKDRFDLITGIVGGFSMMDVELVWVKAKDPNVEQHTRHRADEVEFVSELKMPKPKVKSSSVDLASLTVDKLKEMAKKIPGVTGISKLNKAALTKLIKKKK